MAEVGWDCFTCSSQLWLSRSIPAPCRGQVWWAPSQAPALFHWLCYWGRSTCCSDPWSRGCGKTRWNETHLKRRELPCPGNEHGLKREENVQITPMNSITTPNYVAFELFNNKKVNNEALIPEGSHIRYWRVNSRMKSRWRSCHPALVTVKGAAVERRHSSNCTTT